MADVFLCAKLEGTSYEFICYNRQSHVGNRAKIQSVARLGCKHLVGRTSIMPRVCAESRQHEAANQSIRGVSCPHWRLALSPGVKTEGMTLRLRASHIHSCNLGARNHIRGLPHCLIEGQGEKKQNTCFHTLFTAGSFIFSPGVNTATVGQRSGFGCRPRM